MRGGTRAAVIVLAAGEGVRVGAGVNKVLLPLAGSPVLTWSLRSISELTDVARVVLVIREEDRPVVEGLLAEHSPGSDVMIVAGGTTRHDSESNALTAIAGAIDAGEVEVVAIHDAARPLAGSELFAAVIGSAAEHGGAIPVREQVSLVQRDQTPVPGAEGRLVAVQTPQAFRAEPLLGAYRQAAAEGFVGTDTASCVERYCDLAIHCVPGPATNLKVTYSEDVALAERLLEQLGRV